MEYPLSELYEMYKRAVDESSYCRIDRAGGSFGIAVNKDPLARKFQKWDALARRLDLAIRCKIDEIEQRQESTRQNSPYKRRVETEEDMA